MWPEYCCASAAAVEAILAALAQDLPGAIERCRAEYDLFHAMLRILFEIYGLIAAAGME